MPAGDNEGGANGARKAAGVSAIATSFKMGDDEINGFFPFQNAKSSAPNMAYIRCMHRI